MLYLGIDCHRSFSYCTILNGKGQTVFRGKLPHDDEVYEDIFVKEFQEEKIAVVEAGYNWGTVYEILTGLGIETKVGNPSDIKAIASARIKTDKRDSETLAYLLKADLIPEIYVPPKEARELKCVLRERLSIVKDKTRIKNKIHNLLVRNRAFPENMSDIFGKTGRKYIDSLELEENSSYLLKHSLENLDLKTQELKDIEKYLRGKLKEDENIKLLRTIPGIGEILGTLISLELHDIQRFPNAKRFSSYCGLVPTVRSSGQKKVTGHLIKQCNKYLKTALVECCWIAVNHSSYFSHHYDRLKVGKNKKVAICGVARKMSVVIYHVLNEKRPFVDRIPEKAYKRYMYIKN